MGIFGYDSVGDMFDGGGPGASSPDQNNKTYDNDNDPNNKVTGIAAMSNSFAGNSAANAGGGNDDRVAYTTDASGNSVTTQPKGVAPTNFLQKVSPTGIIATLAGWANNLDPTKDTTSVVGGRQVYDNGKMQYSYNFLGLPYEVKVIGGVVTDALSIPGDDGLTGYQRMAQTARDSGDNDRADQIMQEATDNAQDAGGGASSFSTDDILAMAAKAGMAESNEQIQAILNDPQAWLVKNNALLADKVPTLDADTAGTNLDPTNPNYLLGDSPAFDVATGEAVTADGITNPGATTYDATTITNRMSGDAYTADAKTGEIKDRNLVDAEQIDMVGAATGVNADGSTSVVGEALNDFAFQDISRIIDTSTIAGKLLAEKLGQGNYTDAKATVLGQMKIISDEFKDSNGNPKIPAWAQGLAREAQRTMAFSGVTGTAATAAMSNAIMEATLGVADKEASFFQTLTIKNLDNRQQAVINKANVIAQFEVANLDARQASAVQNAKAFLEMDMANLTNEQQSEVINTQSMVEALFNDQAAINASRLFGAEQTNDMAKFYDNMMTQVQIHRAEQINQMSKFNAGEKNDGAEFMANMEQSRQEFYASMQYNVDLANAKWRQSVADTNNQNQFEAATTDVKNIMDISQEAMNRLWDRVDNTLDYIFKGWNAESDRDATILAAQMQAQASSSGGGNGFMDGLFKLGAAWITRGSDERMKTDVQYYDTVKGIKYYTWKWNDKAKSIGWDRYPEFGVIAQQVQKTHPEAVIKGPEGYLMVNYGMLQ